MNIDKERLRDLRDHVNNAGFEPAQPGYVARVLDALFAALLDEPDAANEAAAVEPGDAFATKIGG